MSRSTAGHGLFELTSSYGYANLGRIVLPRARTAQACQSACAATPCSQLPRPTTSACIIASTDHFAVAAQSWFACDADSGALNLRNLSPTLPAAVRATHRLRLPPATTATSRSHHRGLDTNTTEYHLSALQPTGLRDF